MWQCLHGRLSVVSAFVLPCLLAAEPAGPSGVTGIRFWSFGDATRIVVETTGEFELHSDRAVNPERLFFDLAGSRMRLGGKGQRIISVGDRLVKQIRVAETAPSITRVVFDLETSVDFTASQLTNPDRLIIELRAAGTLPAPIAPDVPMRVTTQAELETIPAKAASPATVAVATVAAKIPVVEPARKPPRTAKLNGSQSLTRVLGLKIGRIVIDPGHGGHDTGTAGRAGLLEKDLVLDVAKRLGALIETRMGAEVVYTRSDDTFIPLESRTQMANDKRADLFLSIHANSSSSRSSSGVETYYLNFTSSPAALEVAARENAASQKAVYELKDLLQKIALQDKIDESKQFAATLQSALVSSGGTSFRDRGVKKAPFVVLIGASMPSILVEIGFISNPKDEALFKKASHRQRVAERLYKGLSQYASTLSEFQVAKN